MILRGRNGCNFLSSPRPCVWGQFTVGSGHYSSVSGLIIQVLGIQGYAEGTVWSRLWSLAPCSFSPELKPIHFGCVVLWTGGDITHARFPTTAGREAEASYSPQQLLGKPTLGYMICNSPQQFLPSQIISVWERRNDIFLHGHSAFVYLPPCHFLEASCSLAGQ